MRQRWWQCNRIFSMKSIFLISSLFLLVSCGMNKKRDSASAVTINNIADSTDYCKVCDSLDKWQGGIQGVDKSDSTGIYPMAECHTNKHFDLLWVPRGDILKFTSSVGQDSLS